MKSMKNIWKSLWMLAFVAPLLTSCGSGDEVTPATFSTEEAAAELGQVLSSELNNVVLDADQISVRAQGGRYSAQPTRAQGCGDSYDSAFQKSYSGPHMTFSLSMSYVFSLSCTQLQVPTAVNLDYQASVTREGKLTASSGSSTGDFALSNLEPRNAAYLLNGTSIQSCEVRQLTERKGTFSSTSTLMVADVQIDKETKTILGGGGSATISGSGSGGNDFTYTASVVFNGDQTATIVIQGKTYTVHLPTGELRE
jgi:hypothetical protein